MNKAAMNPNQLRFPSETRGCGAIVACFTASYAMRTKRLFRAVKSWKPLESSTCMHVSLMVFTHKQIELGSIV